MNSAVLKILACLFMLIDHIGSIFFPGVMIFRIIGRLAFPLFAFFIAEGYRKTKDTTHYLGRLFLFALISQIPFVSAFGETGLYLNIFFTLGMGLYAIFMYNKYKKIHLVILIALVCQFMNTDYGAYGVLLIFLLDRYFDDFKNMVKSAALLTVIYQLTVIAPIFITNPHLPLEYIMQPRFFIQILSLTSFVFIKHYNGQRGINLKYFFYIFYPGHLIILSLLNQLIIR